MNKLFILLTKALAVLFGCVENGGGTGSSNTDFESMGFQILLQQLTDRKHFCNMHPLI